ncbi:hypothetical protein AVEN_111236-1 [Araneus ventricosus]|uniref:Uncharacterized protein n=1 Tax=Araneus ventricosus TaxID=182803 RepID=A0A4Y2EL59_ARAVE|nr:hypothetical protein AVEN_111236-1 [Araneus ventricosus]
MSHAYVHGRIAIASDSFLNCFMSWKRSFKTLIGYLFPPFKTFWPLSDSTTRSSVNMALPELETWIQEWLKDTRSKEPTEYCVKITECEKLLKSSRGQVSRYTKRLKLHEQESPERQAVMKKLEHWNNGKNYFQDLLNNLGVCPLTNSHIHHITETENLITEEEMTDRLSTCSGIEVDPDPPTQITEEVEQENTEEFQLVSSRKAAKILRREEPAPPIRT